MQCEIKIDYRQFNTNGFFPFMLTPQRHTPGVFIEWVCVGDSFPVFL